MELPPGYEIVPGDAEVFVKKDGEYILSPSKRKSKWSKKSEKTVYEWCWKMYRQEANIPFEDYARIVQIIPVQPNWEAVFLHDHKEHLFCTIPIVCWAQVEILDGPYKRTHVVGMIANEDVVNDRKNVLTLISEDDTSFLGYTYPGNETDWKHEAYECIKRHPGVSGYEPEDVVFWEQEELREKLLKEQQSDESQQPDSD